MPEPWMILAFSLATRDKDRRANQVLHRVPDGRKSRKRRRKNWTETVKNDLRGLDISWERAEEGRGAGDGQSRVEKMCCPMCRHTQDAQGLRLMSVFLLVIDWWRCSQLQNREIASVDLFVSLFSLRLIRWMLTTMHAWSNSGSSSAWSGPSALQLMRMDERRSTPTSVRWMERTRIRTQSTSISWNQRARLGFIGRKSWSKDGSTIPSKSLGSFSIPFKFCANFLIWWLLLKIIIK